MTRQAWLAVVIAAWAGTASACTLERRALLPVSFAQDFVSVPATVAGRPARFLLDTGAEDMLVTPEAAARLGLAPDPSHSTLMMGTGGQMRVGNVWLAGLRLGAARLAPRSVAVASLPKPVPGDGLLGAPLLTRYDVDLDLAHDRVGLYRTRDCAADTPMLPPPFTAVTLTLTPDRVPAIPVVVNGVTLMALLDTGSRATALMPAAAARVHAVMLRTTGTARGVDGEAVMARGARVRTLAVGWDVQRRVQVAVAPLQIGGADMLLGVDWLRQRRVWISYAGRQVFVALHYDWHQAARR